MKEKLRDIFNNIESCEEEIKSLVSNKINLRSLLTSLKKEIKQLEKENSSIYHSSLIAKSGIEIMDHQMSTFDLSFSKSTLEEDTMNNKAMVQSIKKAITDMTNEIAGLSVDVKKMLYFYLNCTITIIIFMCTYYFLI